MQHALLRDVPVQGHAGLDDKGNPASLCPVRVPDISDAILRHLSRDCNKGLAD